ncbi:MAG TPA: alcohol dehydrogenase catalytic domain-containing protein, partial [Ramlibacter sp.]|nr:alcohol dehydrogenase catalytic domain-containing protein [Ramlibacter sp.]
MQAILLRQPGSLDTIELADAPMPHAGPGELLVRVLAAGVNPADWKVAQRGMPGWRLPQVLGLDGVGIVEAVADGVQGFRPGNTVWFHQGLTRLGAFAEHIAVEALPKKLSMDAMFTMHPP